MKLEPAKDKYELLYQGFVLLFTCPTSKHREEVSEMIGCMLLDPDITHERAQNACVRAIEVLQLEKNLMKQFGGKNG